MVNFCKEYLHRLCFRPNTCQHHHSSLLWHQSALNRKTEDARLFFLSAPSFPAWVSPVEMLLTAQVPQELRAPDTVSPTSNYSLTFGQQEPAAPISPRPRAASETRPRSVIHSLIRDSCAFAQPIRHWLLTGGWMNEWTDGWLGVYLNEIPQQDGGDREALLKKSTDALSLSLCLLTQVTEALRVIHDILVQTKLFKDLQNICTT